MHTVTPASFFEQQYGSPIGLVRKYHQSGHPRLFPFPAFVRHVPRFSRSLDTLCPYFVRWEIA